MSRPLLRSSAYWSATLRALPELKRQFLRFLVVGAIAAGLSFCAYVSLVLLGFHTAWANAASFIAGSTISYCLNRRFTFASPVSGFGRIAAFIALYLFTLIVQVGLNESLLHVFGKNSLVLIAGCWCVAVGVSSVLNFLGLRFLIFRK